MLRYLDRLPFFFRENRDLAQIFCRNRMFPVFPPFDVTFIGSFTPEQRTEPVDRKIADVPVR